MLTALDHVNLRTPDLDKMTEWYETILGLKKGKRPDFSIKGVWLYLNDVAVVHLVLDKNPLPKDPTSLEHFAFRATGMAEFEDKLITAGVSFKKQSLPEAGLVQFNLEDPMGNHLHVDFRDSDS
jgi:catechol 2,3-dioxygenase-like lactoylglutathione lyase family enzyme